MRGVAFILSLINFLSCINLWQRPDMNGRPLACPSSCKTINFGQHIQRFMPRSSYEAFCLHTGVIRFLSDSHLYVVYQLGANVNVHTLQKTQELSLIMFCYIRQYILQPFNYVEVDEQQYYNIK